MEFFSKDNYLVAPNELNAFMGFGQKKNKKVENILNLRFKKKKMIDGKKDFYMSDEIIYHASIAWLNDDLELEDLARIKHQDRVMLACIESMLNVNGLVKDTPEYLAEYAEASNHFVPVLVAGKHGFIPNASNFLSSIGSSAWSCVPGYCFDSEIEGYNTWFTIFMDATGNYGTFYYPSHPVVGEVVKVITPVGVIWWIHGLSGLSGYCSTHYEHWLMELWSYE